MKLTIKIFFPILIVILVYLVFGKFPDFHNYKDIDRIIIKTTIREYNNWPDMIYLIKDRIKRPGFPFEIILTNNNQFNEFKKALGITWDGIFPLNSFEDYNEYYIVTICFKNNKNKIIQFTEKEWGSSGKTPKIFLDYLKKLMG